MNDEGMTDELINHVLQNIGSDSLTDWERDFVKSVRAYWNKHHRLSSKQQKRLKQLWEELHDGKRVDKGADQ